MKTILFVLDGSPLASTAARQVIQLAQACQGKIIAQFVIDPQKLFDLEGFSGPGLCGSGVFIETEQALIPPLMHLGEMLMMSFTARAEGAGIEVEDFIDVGNPAQEIALRAAGSDLVVLPATEANYIASDSLRATVSCPILLVESEISSSIVQIKDVSIPVVEAFKEVVACAELRIAVDGSDFVAA